MAIIVIIIMIIGVILLAMIAKISDKQQGIKKDNEAFKKEIYPTLKITFIIISLIDLGIFICSPFIISYIVFIYG